MEGLTTKKYRAAIIDQMKRDHLSTTFYDSFVVLEESRAERELIYQEAKEVSAAGLNFFLKETPKGIKLLVP